MLFVDALLDVVGEIGLWVFDNEFRESSDYRIVVLDIFILIRGFTSCC